MPLPEIFIRNIAVKIHPDYQLDNAPFGSSSSRRTTKGAQNATSNKFFFGRIKLRLKLLEFLKNGGEQGVYLITGYRGMGKTSFVQDVLREYHESLIADNESKKDQLHIINITLSQHNLSEEIILKNIVNRLYSKLIVEAHETSDTALKALESLVIFFGILLIFPVLVFFYRENAISFVKGNQFGEFFLFSQGIAPFVIITFLTTITVLFSWRKLRRRRHKSLQLIETLYLRCYSSFSVERDNRKELSIESLNTKFIAPEERKTYNYPIASAREVEDLLSEFFLAYKKDFKTKLIFVFDELDKIDPPAITTTYYQDLESFEATKNDNNYLQQLRTRKQTIITIIAGLKSFLTTTSARFFFIAGREMFDASLADIADRESHLSSIFTYVFYVESFLKEINELKNSSSLSQSIEDYLCWVLFRKKYSNFYDELRSVLDKQELTSNQKSIKLSDAEKCKVITMMQNFIIYLTYRSNGSPKKLIRAIHEFIRTEIKEGTSKVIVADAGNIGQKRCLYFNYNDQYRIGFINYLYRPFLIKYGRSFKSYSDNIISSTPYLFDHFFKFHPFAFSLKSLELIPEVLATSKTPSLREHITKIIDYLYNSSIRETEIGLFDYKFYNRIVNEITFISKTFEPESAAFNFTLDESYLIKLHVRTKVKELRSIYSRSGDQQNTSDNFSIYYLHTVLGDLHFFDQEYDDAIVAYSDALNSASKFSFKTPSFLGFSSRMQCRLKLGLIFEKIGSYQEALSFYIDAREDAKEFVRFRLMEIKSDRLIHPDAGQSSTKQVLSLAEAKSHLSSLLEVSQNISQAFLAEFCLQEKMGLDGLTPFKLKEGLVEFLTILSELDDNAERKYLVISNFLLVIGNLFFFKNSNTRELNYGKDLREADSRIDKILFYLNKIQQTTSENSLLAYESRKPTIALASYMTGLEEVISSIPRGPGLKLAGINWDRWSMGTSLISLVRSKGVYYGPLFTKNHLRYIAIFLSNIGNCFLSMVEVMRDGNYKGVHINDIFNRDRYLQLKGKSGLLSLESGLLDIVIGQHTEPETRLNNLLSSFTKESSTQERERTVYEIQRIPVSIGHVIQCFYLSALYFSRAGRASTSCYQLKKILYVLRMSLVDHTRLSKTELLAPEFSEQQKTNRDFLDFLQSYIMEPISQINSRISEFSDKHMSNKLTKILEPYENCQEYVLNNISNHPETREPLMLYHCIRLKLINNIDGVGQFLISSCNSIASQFTRLLEFDYFQKYCYRQLQHSNFFESSEELVPVTEQENRAEIGSHYLSSLISVINILNIYGISYSISYNYLAYTHLKIALFLERINTPKLAPVGKLVKEKIRVILGSKISFVLDDVKYHYQLARVNYEKSIRLHTVGYEYKNAMNDLIYLEDDINDNAFHFGAAMERYLFTNELLETSLKKCIDGLSRC